MDGKRRFLLLGVLALTAFVPRSLAAQLAPVGPEVRVDTPRAGLPLGCPALAAAPDGAFEIVWDYQDSGDFNAYGRHYAPNGEPTDPAPVPISRIGENYYHPQIEFATAIPDGFQVFILKTDSPFNGPSFHFRQRLDSAGAPVGPPEALKPGTRFVAGLEGRLYASQYQGVAKNLALVPVAPSGKPLGARIVLNTRPIDAPFLAPQLAPLGGGDFVALWNGVSVAKRGAPARQVLRARIVRQGRPVGQDFDVNVSPGGAPNGRPILFDTRVVSEPSSGGFAAVWRVWGDAFNFSVHLRFFDASGRPRTSEIVAVPSAPKVTFFAAGFDDAGNLLLLWRPPLDGILRARLFAAASGTPLGPAFQIGPNPAPAICGDAAWTGDSWLATWVGRNRVNGSSAVFVRRFR
jgi:hypothetical protein